MFPFITISSLFFSYLHKWFQKDNADTLKRCPALHSSRFLRCRRRLSLLLTSFDSVSIPTGINKKARTYRNWDKSVVFFFFFNVPGSIFFPPPVLEVRNVMEWSHRLCAFVLDLQWYKFSVKRATTMRRLNTTALKWPIIKTVTGLDNFFNSMGNGKGPEVVTAAPAECSSSQTVK